MSRLSTGISGFGKTKVVGTFRPGTVRIPRRPAKTYMPSVRDSGRSIAHVETFVPASIDSLIF